MTSLAAGSDMPTSSLSMSCAQHARGTTSWTILRAGKVALRAGKKNKTRMHKCYKLHKCGWISATTTNRKMHFFCLPSRQIQTVSGPGPARTGGHKTSPVRSGPDGRTDGQTLRTHCTRAVESMLQQQANHKMQALCLAPHRIQTDGSTDTHVYQIERRTDGHDKHSPVRPSFDGRTDGQTVSINTTTRCELLPSPQFTPLQTGPVRSGRTV